LSFSTRDAHSRTELDALGLEDEAIGEGETPSYLQDATALPDFIDAAPLEDPQVSCEKFLLSK
jgi:charged multivesicular body protein 5